MLYLEMIIIVIILVVILKYSFFGVQEGQISWMTSSIVVVLFTGFCDLEKNHKKVKERITQTKCLAQNFNNRMHKRHLDQ